ncbi:MAG: glycosyltransferase family 39 protein [Bacteroidetes bacterium]|nr:MAG: glycosyltransferase family 39 protein [Bacteroidota bacterium]
MPKSEFRTVKTQKLPSSEFLLFPFLKSWYRHPLAGPVLAAAYAVVMLHIGLTYHVVGDYNVETDFFQAYVPTAKDFLKGVWTIEDFRGPGYPALLAAAGLFVRDFFTAGIVLSTLAAAVTLYFTFETVRRLFRADLAFAVVLLTAVNRTFVQYSYTAGTDMVFNAFTAGIIFFLLRKETLSWPDLALSALFGAAAYLTRSNGIVFLAAVPFIMAVVNVYNLPVKQRLVASGVWAGLFLLFITPWGMHTLAEKGSFFFSRNHLNIAYEMFGKGKVGWDEFWNVESVRYTSLLQVVMTDPGLFVSTVFSNLYGHFLSDMELLMNWFAGIGVLAAVISMVKRRPDRRQGAFFLFGASLFLVLLIVFYGERFSMYLIPMYGVLALGTLVWDRWRGIPYYSATLLAAALIGYTAYGSVEYNRQHIDSGPREIKAIADWFNQNVKDADPSKVVVCRKPHIAFYIDKTMKYFPYVDTWPALEAETKRLGADYLFYGIYEANMRPQFRQLLDPSAAPPWLEPVTYTVNPPSVLYRVKH